MEINLPFSPYWQVLINYVFPEPLYIRNDQSKMLALAPENR